MTQLERALSGVESGIASHMRQDVVASNARRERRKGVRLFGAHVRCNSVVSVLSGPLVGEVSETEAVILLEINAPSSITCYVSVRDVSTPDGRLVTSTSAFLNAGVPGRFVVKNLTPGQSYWFCFGGIKRRDTNRRVGCFTTWGGRRTPSVRLAFVGESSKMGDVQNVQHSSLWSSLARKVEEESIHLVVHLGGQVNGVGHEMRSGVWSSDVRRNLETQLSAEQYRYVLNASSVRTVFSRTSNLCVCGQGDRELGRQCYRLFQSQLCMRDDRTAETASFHHAHRWGPIGMFCLHRYGTTRWAGESTNLSVDVMSTTQMMESFEKMLSQEDVRALLIVSSAPLVDFSSAEARDIEAKMLIEASGKWFSTSQRDVRNKILSRLFEWKRERRNSRDVLIVCGGANVSAETEIRDERSTKDNVTLRQLSVGPMCNGEQDFLPNVRGHIETNHQGDETTKATLFTYAHTPRYRDCSLAIVTLQPYNETGPKFLTLPASVPAVMPWPMWPAISFEVQWHVGIVDSIFSRDNDERSLVAESANDQSRWKIRVGPVVGRVTPSTAVVLCEAVPVGNFVWCQVGCTLVDTLDGSEWRRVLRFGRETGPLSFYFSTLRPDRQYSVLLDDPHIGTSPSSSSNLRNRTHCGVITTPPINPTRLRLLVLCGGDSGRIQSDVDPYIDVVDYLVRRSHDRDDAKHDDAYMTLHMGGQVAVWRYFQAALRARHDALDETTSFEAARDVVRDAFRWQMSIPSVAFLLSNASNVIVPGIDIFDGSVQSTFSSRIKVATDAVDRGHNMMCRSTPVPSWLMKSAAARSREYHRQLWDPDWKDRVSAMRTAMLSAKRDVAVSALTNRVMSTTIAQAIERDVGRNYHFETIGSFGMFVFDLWDGVGGMSGSNNADEVTRWLSDEQWKCLDDVLSNETLKTLVLVSERPFVLDMEDDATLKRDVSETDSCKTRPSRIAERSWTSNMKGLTDLLRRIFRWTRKRDNRAVLLLCTSDHDVLPNKGTLETDIVAMGEDEKCVGRVRQIICPSLKSRRDRRRSLRFEMSGTLSSEFKYNHRPIVHSTASSSSRDEEASPFEGFVEVTITSQPYSYARAEVHVMETKTVNTGDETSRIDADVTRKIPEWYARIRSAVRDDVWTIDEVEGSSSSAAVQSMSRHVKDLLKALRSEMAALEKRWRRAGIMGPGGAAAATLRKERMRAKQKGSNIERFRQSHLGAWRSACDVLLRAGCSGLERKEMRLPSACIVEAVLSDMGDVTDAGVNDGSKTDRERFARDVIARCTRMLVETRVCREISRVKDTLDATKIRYEMYEKMRRMPGEREVESEHGDAENRREFLKSSTRYDSAYLSVMQRRKYAWMRDHAIDDGGEEQKNKGESILSDIKE